jgi:hypothetical protein
MKKAESVTTIAREPLPQVPGSGGYNILKYVWPKKIFGQTILERNTILMNDFNSLFLNELILLVN